MTDRSQAGESPVVQVESAADAPREHRFRALYHAEFEFVWAVARRFGVPPAAIDDAVQEVFLTVFRRLDILRYEVSPRAWLYQVTRKIAARHHRGTTRLARRVAAFAAVTTDTSESPQARHEAAHLLARLLAQLPRGTREVWELTEVLGMSGPEIAGELQLPLNTVYSRLRLARAQLLTHSSAEQVAGCVAATRRAEAAPPDASHRSWAALLPALGKPAAAITSAGALAGSHPALATPLIAAAAATALVVVPPLTRAPSPAPSPSATVEPAALTAPRADMPAIATAPAAPLPAPARAAGPRDRLAAEVALIDRAHADLNAGDLAAALTVLARHTREFPDGTLKDAREAARIEVLCRQGEREAAELAARRLFTASPESLVARRFKHYVCTP